MILVQYRNFDILILDSQLYKVKHYISVQKYLVSFMT